MGRDIIHGSWSLLLSDTMVYTISERSTSKTTYFGKLHPVINPSSVVFQQWKDRLIRHDVRTAYNSEEDS